MRMEQLRCLVDIAETHSITSTAQRMYINQQALSKSMKQLEQELGAQLLVRTNRGVHLTREGEKILEYASQMTALEDNIRKTCAEKTNGQEPTSEIRICSASSVTNIVLPNIMAKLNQWNSSISLKIDTTNDIDDFFQQVSSGACDLGILTYNATAFQDKMKDWSEYLEAEELLHDEMLVVTDRRYLKEHLDYFPLDEFSRHIRTSYNVIPIDETRDLTNKVTMTSSGDADFHRRMIEKAGAVVTMAGLTYQHFFSAKKYVGLPMEKHAVELLHTAIYRKDSDIRLQQFIAMIRRELYTT